jgi:hypothetical protein
VVFGSSYKIELATAEEETLQKSKSSVYVAIVKKPDTPSQSFILRKFCIANLGTGIHTEIKEYKSTVQQARQEPTIRLPQFRCFILMWAPSKISSATSINVDSTAGFPNQGRSKYTACLPRPVEMSTTGKTTASFTGLTRGVLGSTAAEHWNDAFVWLSTRTTGYTDMNVGSTYGIKSVRWNGADSK